MCFSCPEGDFASGRPVHHGAALEPRPTVEWCSCRCLVLLVVTGSLGQDLPSVTVFESPEAPSDVIENEKMSSKAHDQKEWNRKSSSISAALPGAEARVSLIAMIA